MFAFLVIGTFIVCVFAFELIRAWWRQNAWRRRWRDPKRDEFDD